MMDSAQYPGSAAVKERFLRSLPANVRYLENSGVEYQGIQIWGSPLTVSRAEDIGKRYLSDAFERKRAERAMVWSQIPENVDVLMTHTPPHGRLCFEEFGCKYLTERLNSLNPPPSFHCFGHDHDYFGVAANDHTTFINGAQEEVLRMYKGAEGCSWVFDVPRPIVKRAVSIG